MLWIIGAVVGFIALAASDEDVEASKQNATDSIDKNMENMSAKSKIVPKEKYCEKARKNFDDL